MKKGVALFKMTSVKKVVNSKGVAKKWLWWYGKNFNNNNSGEFFGESWDEATQIDLNCCLLKFLPSTYTITAILGCPPLISQLFSH